jgi:transposase
MPGLKPRYRPQFTVNQIEEAKRISNKHSAPHNIMQRAKLVLLLHQQPDMDNPQAARLLGRHENWVRYWRKRWATEGFSLSDKPRSGRKPTLSADDHALIKAIACEFPRQRRQPLSRYSTMDIVRVVKAEQQLDHVSPSSVWRILAHDAIKPWRFRCWIFPRDPEFLPKARPILELYQGVWQGQPLGARDFVICADEKTSIQARRRRYPSQPAAANQLALFEHEYQRQGALQYLAALDVHPLRLFGRCEPTTGKAPFGRLVDDVMRQPPYSLAERVFWIVDNGSSHRGAKAAAELRERYDNLMLIHTPIHASWLNQIEIYFSILQRKVLTPNDFKNTKELEQRLLAFQNYYMKTAKPFNWKYTCQDLERQFQRLRLAA